jgi:hypothetical protein
MVWRGAYNASTSYAIGDGVSFGGSSYIAIAAGVLPAPPSASWNLIAQQGAQGPTGAQGAQGVAGAQGPQGVAGPTGPQGAQGVAGTAGEGWYSGSGAPTGALGNVNDWYLDSATGNFYEKTGASAWTQRGNLLGPAGPQGVQGAQGPQGPQGVAGSPLDMYFRQSVAPSNAGNVAILSGGDLLVATGGAAYEIAFTPTRNCVYRVLAVVNIFSTGSAKSEAELDPYIIAPAGQAALTACYATSNGASVWMQMQAEAYFNAVSGTAYRIRMKMGYLAVSTFSYATNPIFTQLVGMAVG